MPSHSFDAEIARYFDRLSKTIAATGIVASQSSLNILVANAQESCGKTGLLTTAYFLLELRTMAMDDFGRSFLSVRFGDLITAIIRRDDLGSQRSEALGSIAESLLTRCVDAPDIRTLDDLVTHFEKVVTAVADCATISFYDKISFHTVCVGAYKKLCQNHDESVLPLDQFNQRIFESVACLYHKIDDVPFPATPETPFWIPTQKPGPGGLNGAGG